MATKRILVVGGIDKNVPTWIHRAFEVEHYEQQAHFKRAIAPRDRPDAVIVLKSWISHKQCQDAREYAEQNGIPVIISDGGWAMAVQRALESGLEWFAHAVDKTIGDLSETDAKTADEIVERAWEGAYKREYEKTKALEKRLRKGRDVVERTQSAAKRVIAEVREAARKRQEAADRTQAEIKRLAAEARARQAEIVDITTKLLESEATLQLNPELVSELRARLKALEI